MSLARYAVMRALTVVATFVFSLIAYFFLTRVIPSIAIGGNPFIPSQSLDPLFRAVVKPSDDPGYSSWVSSLISTYGLSRPLLPDQLLIFLKNSLTMDFGYSLLSMRSVSSEILMRLPYTLALYTFAVIVPIFVGYYLAIVASKARGRVLDLFLTLSSLFSFSVPIWVYILIIYYLLAYLPKVSWGIQIFPLPVRAPTTNIEGIQDIRYWLWYLSPLYLASILSLYGAWTYFFRAILASEISEDYTLTARAKGLSEWDVIRSEVVPNIRPPVLTKIAYSIPAIFGGSIALEIVSSWPGIAYYAYQAIQNNDYPVMNAFFVVSTLLVALSLYISDIAVAILDPRVRYGIARYTR